MERGGTRAAGSPPKKAMRSPRERVDWKGDAMTRVRRLIHDADSEIIEERKWKKPSNPAGIPVWSREGIVCTGETYASHLRLTFASGASLPDPAGLFNSGLEGKVTRAIVLREGDDLDETAFKSLVRAAAAFNVSSSRR
jgi:hypothetical protein